MQQSHAAIEHFYYGGMRVRLRTLARAAQIGIALVLKAFPTKFPLRHIGARSFAISVRQRVLLRCSKVEMRQDTVLQSRRDASGL